MKFKLIPTERRITHQFKPQKIEVAEAESEMKRLIALSTDKFKGQVLTATLNFDDGSGAGALTSSPVAFQAGTSTNVSYYAVQMLSERYAAASQELKDEFLNQLDEALAIEEEITLPAKRDERPAALQSPPQKTCSNCGEAMAATMVYCPYCGESQEITQEKAPEVFPAPPKPIRSEEKQLLSAVQDLIRQKQETRRSKMEQSITTKLHDQRAEALAEKEEEIEHKKQGALNEAKQKYEATVQAIEKQAIQESETELRNLETTFHRKIAEEIEQAMQADKDSVQTLIAGLTDLLESDSDE